MSEVYGESADSYSSTMVCRDGGLMFDLQEGEQHPHGPHSMQLGESLHCPSRIAKKTHGYGINHGVYPILISHSFRQGHVDTSDTL